MMASRCTADHVLEYSLWSMGHTWCPKCQSHFYGNPEARPALNDLEKKKNEIRQASDKHWLVTVESHGETLVTIESEGMGGKDNLTEEELKMIRTAAEHLLAFAGEAGEGFEMPEGE